MIHQYKLNGYNIVLDIGSGSVHTVDDVAYDMIAMYADKSREEILDAMLEKYGDRADVTREELSDCYDDITALRDAGKLFSDDDYEVHAADLKNRSQVVKALCLHVARIPVIWTAPIALPHRGSTMANAR